MKAHRLIVLIYALLFTMLVGNLFGDTIFNETMGSAGSVTEVNSYTGWLNYGSVYYSGSADARSTYNSSGDYPGASGGGNIYFVGGMSDSYQIAAINTMGYTNIRLACGIYKSNSNAAAASAENGSNLQIKYSTDGSNWSAPLAYTLPTGTGTDGTYYWITFSEDLPVSPFLCLKFTNVGLTEPVHFRLDDVTVTGTTFNLYNETVGVGASGVLVPLYTGWSNPAPIIYSGPSTVENNYTSTGSYTGATGTGNVFVGHYSYFQISGINTVGYGLISLAFGIHKDTGAESGSNLKVEAFNGATLVATAYNNIYPNSNDIWVSHTVFSALPATTNLILKFTNISSTRDFRIDDIKIRAGVKLPILASPTAVNITNTMALLGASITTLNNGNASERGIYYSTTDGFANGTGTKVSETGTFSSTGAFSIGVTGLTPNTVYYYKGFATNIGGTGYTTQGTFTTTNIIPPTVSLPTAAGITNTTAVLGANITTLPDGVATERGIYYSTTDGFADGAGTKVSETGSYTATGAFTVSVTGLLPNTVYYYKGFAANIDAIGYTLQETFSTANMFPPTVILPTATDLTNTTAVLGASITAYFNSDATERGIYYSTTDGFADGTGTKVSETGIYNATGAFTIGVTGLSPNTVYYYKGFATNAYGSGYSTQESFTTTNVFPPTVSANATADLTDLGATLNGTISSTNNAEVTERGFYYSSLNGFADGAGTKVSETGNFATGAYSLSLTGLDTHTQYYFKAFATNAAGTGYSAQGMIIPTTLPALASIVSPVNAAVVTETATLNWTDGGGFTYGFKLFMGTDSAATNLTPAGGLDLGYVTTYAPALSNGNTYYWQIQPYNSLGTNSAGTITSFDVVMPLSGTKIIGPGGDYESFTAAINALNRMGVATGGITFNVTAGTVFTETMPIPAITATGTLADQIIFQKSGAGANPIVQATGTSGGRNEFFFKLQGADYVTFDGIDLRNTGATTLMDNGYQLECISDNGCNNNTIKNSTVTLDVNNTSTMAIICIAYVYATDTNSNNKFINNTINNAVFGYWLYNASSNYDTGNEISTASGTTAINNVIVGVDITHQVNARINNQIITLSASATRYMSGIMLSTSTADIYDNVIQNGSSSLNFSIIGIHLSYSAESNVYNNVIRGLSSSSSGVTGIALGNGSANIYNNKVSNLAYTGTGTSVVTGIMLWGDNSYAYNNQVWDLRAPASTNSAYSVAGIENRTGNNRIYNNTVYLYQTATGSGAVTTAAFVINSTTTLNDIRNNIFVNKSAATANSASRTFAIYRSYGSGFPIMSSSSGRNIYYARNAALPGTRDYIYYEDNRGYQTIAAYHTAAGSVDNISWSEDVPFDQSNLPHIATGTPTFVEGNGLPITAPEITFDIDADIRNASNPDIGADEGNFTIFGAVPLASIYPFPNNDVDPIYSVTTSFSWSSPIDQTHGAAHYFKFYLRTSTGTYEDLINGINIGNVLTYTPATPLQNGTCYFWKVVPVNAAGETVNPTEWALITQYLPFSGIYTIDNTLPTGGTNFATFKSALNALNNTAIAGPTTFQVTAGQSFTETSLYVNFSGAQSTPVTFVKYGSAANPVIKAGVGTSSYDAIISIYGTDYLTFDGIDLSENIGVNTTATTQAEKGFNIGRAADGAQHNTIQNCSITLANPTSTNTYGVYTSSNASNANEACSYNRFLDVNISGCLTGYNLNGTDYASAEDVGNEISATNGGGIISGCTTGVKYQAQKSFKIYGQTITMPGGALSNDVKGIFGVSGSACTVEIYGNNISMIAPVTTNINSYGIYVTVGITAIHDNLIHDISNTYSSQTTSNMIGIYVGYGTTDIYSNQVYNLSTIGQINYGIYTSSYSGTDNIYSNVIHDLSCGNSLYGLYSINGGVNNVYGNEIYNLTITGNASIMTGMQHNGGGVCSIYNNVVHDLVQDNTYTGNIYGILTGVTDSCEMYDNVVRTITSTYSNIIGLYLNAGTANIVRNNKVYDLRYYGTGASSICGIQISNGVTHYVYNNFVSDLIAPTIFYGTSPQISGVYVNGGTNVYLRYNTIFLKSIAVGQYLNSAAVNISSLGPQVQMKNNIFINKSATGSTGKAVCLWKSYPIWTNITSDNNVLYVGVGDLQRMISYDGSNGYSVLDAYQGASGKDTHSYSGDINFVNSVTAPFDLDINPALTSIAAGHGVVISTPIAVTGDYHYQTRATGLYSDLPIAHGPDIGADDVSHEMAPPSVPANVGMTRNGANLLISWDAATGPVNGYIVYGCPTLDFAPATTTMIGYSPSTTRTLNITTDGLPACMFYRVVSY